jgi:hypothetical protein
LTPLRPEAYNEQKLAGARPLQLAPGLVCRRPGSFFPDQAYPADQSLATRSREPVYIRRLGANAVDQW